MDYVQTVVDVTTQVITESSRFTLLLSNVVITKLRFVTRKYFNIMISSLSIVNTVFPFIPKIYFLILQILFLFAYSN